MTALYRVWQPQYGERARDVDPITATDERDAVQEMHDGDPDGPDVQMYCVQRVIGYGLRARHRASSRVRGEKVHVVRSVRRLVRTFEIGEPLVIDELQARCRACGRTFFRLDECPHPSGLCRRCRNR